MTETARMYGGSLYDLAAEEGLDERILGELDGVTALLNGDAEYLHLLSIPSIPKKERCALLDEAFRGQVHLYVPVSYTHLRAHETDSYLVCRLLLEKKKLRAHETGRNLECRLLLEKKKGKKKKKKEEKNKIAEIQ